MKYRGRTPDESRSVRDTTMPFTLHVEHEIVGGKRVREEFEGVEAFRNPPSVSSFHIDYADDRDGERLRYGEVVGATDESRDE